MTSSADGGVHDEPGWYRPEQLRDLVPHDRGVGERGDVLRHDALLGGAGGRRDGDGMRSRPLIDNPPTRRRTSGCLPERTGWEAGGVGAFHRAGRGAADERTGCLLTGLSRPGCGRRGGGSRSPFGSWAGGGKRLDAEVGHRGEEALVGLAALLVPAAGVPDLDAVEGADDGDVTFKGGVLAEALR